MRLERPRETLTGSLPVLRLVLSQPQVVVRLERLLVELHQTFDHLHGLLRTPRLHQQGSQHHDRFDVILLGLQGPSISLFGPVEVPRFFAAISLFQRPDRLPFRLHFRLVPVFSGYTLQEAAQHAHRAPAPMPTAARRFVHGRQGAESRFETLDRFQGGTPDDGTAGGQRNTILQPGACGFSGQTGAHQGDIRMPAQCPQQLAPGLH